MSEVKSACSDIYPLASYQRTKHKSTMKTAVKNPNANPIIERIDREIARQRTSRSAVCVKAGLSRDFLRKMAERGPQASARSASLEKIAGVLGLDFAELVGVGEATEIPPEFENVRGDVRPARIKGLTSKLALRDLPVRGTAAGAVANNGFRLTDDIIDFVARPPALAGIDDAYAIYVTGESMIPLHKPGDLCCVHPGRPCLPGDSVIIQVKYSEDAPIEAYIKTYIRTTPEWVITKQYNPPSEIKYKVGNVYKIHHVMTMREIFGV